MECTNRISSRPEGDHRQRADKISVAALSESRMSGSERVTIEVPDSDQTMTLYYSGGDEHREGVGFMLSNRIVATVVAFQPAEFQCSLLAELSQHIFCVYTPETSSDSVKDEFFGQLQNMVDAIPQSELIVIAGDSNAHVGANRQGWERKLSRFRVGEVNDNGLRLLSFATTDKLVIRNNYFLHPTQSKHF
ncbi:hypothetical protein ANCDUO_08634 [Ancylostoma duodenale]|uniref:Endonuclease/exonuclease/phosphatase domain-containing protein n=1 Tax=Ancylostoma duodenale TaxID=51022 RepID=A0A0C2DF74_9BILA|nr:hypothetical protein ANCDUO_08634 [Ancylostoma duodenale]